jgi:uncharacterized membrane protein
MTDTAIVGENVEIIQTRGARSAFTWSVVIAGALASWAVAFIFISLGSGIGLAVTSPYSGPSAGTMTIAGAIWLILSQTIAYTVGGYLAARLRIRDHMPGPETRFRDGAHGFMAWVIGVGILAAVVLVSGLVSAPVGTSAVGVTNEAMDAARKAAAYASFWSFMALLFGAIAATLAGILGGELRDEA